MSGSEGRLFLVGGAAAADEERVEQAIARATQWLIGAQHARGYGRARSGATANRERGYVFCNRLLGRERPDLERRMAERMLARQQADGSWPQYADGPGNLSTTIESYFALKLTGLSPDEPALARA